MKQAIYCGSTSMKTSGEEPNIGSKGDAPASPPASSASPLVVIVGPTAVGKTTLSLHLAQALDGEIISADSRSFYRGMDIGTAKPTREERARVPHHLIDIADPDETVGLADYQDLAYAAIDDVLARDKLPLLVGGTGQYVQAVVEGWRIPRVAPHPDLREALEDKADRESPYALHDWLKELDPQAAEDIHPHNVRRVVRALEVCLITGRPISEQQGKEPPPYHILQIGLTMDRDKLYERADRRLDVMVETGLLDEVEELLKQGYHWHLPSMSAVGYAELKPLFEDHHLARPEEAAALEEVMAEIRSNLHRFIRHQYNWFSLDDPDIRWFDIAHTSHEEIEAFVRRWLNEL